MLETRGIVGSNGNILLLGLGSIKAVNRTLDDVRTEVRNILIRNGLAPNFQLEITNFLSKKSYVNVKNGASKTVPLNNIPVSIKEIALGSGLTGSSKSRSLITLTRNGKTFRITAGQLFDPNAPEVWIIDKDQIEIDTDYLRLLCCYIFGDYSNFWLNNDLDKSLKKLIKYHIDEKHKKIWSEHYEKAPIEKEVKEVKEVKEEVVEEVKEEVVEEVKEEVKEEVVEEVKEEVEEVEEVVELNHNIELDEDKINTIKKLYINLKFRIALDLLILDYE